MPANVLIVEDEQVICELYSAALEGLGDFTITKLMRADDAVDFLRSGAIPNLVITDMNMPGGSGMDVLKAAKEASADILCMVCSGSIHDRARLEEIADAVMEKPILIGEFVRRVQSLLQKSGARP
ncbi:MAG: response regulator [Planctomycetota bacterium]|nr:response regulator [Planctomycetota bacterium]MDA1140637.1 response regulator [Planctomycetota bacterium]